MTRFDRIFHHSYFSLINKNLSLYIQIPSSYLGFSYRVSVVRANIRESKRAKFTKFRSGGDGGARMNKKAGTQGTLEKLG